MGLYINSIGFIILSVLICSCQSRIIKPFYKKSNEIHVEEYFGTFCEHRSANYSCTDLLIPKLGESFEKKTIMKISSKITDIGINISFSKLVNKYSKNIWIHQEENRLFKSNDLDADYIINNVNSNNKTVLVPIFHIYEHFSLSLNGRQYRVKLALSVIILENNKIIYSNFRKGRTKMITYQDIEELGEGMSILNIHELVDIDKMINKTLKRVMRPYLKRLK